MCESAPHSTLLPGPHFHLVLSGFDSSRQDTSKGWTNPCTLRIFPLGCFWEPSHHALRKSVVVQRGLQRKEPVATPTPKSNLPGILISPLWWLIFMVSLTEFRVTVETHLWVHLWAFLQKGLTGVGEPILCVDGSSPRLNEKEKISKQGSHLSLSPDDRCTVTSCLKLHLPWPSHHDGLCIFQLWAQSKPFLS